MPTSKKQFFFLVTTILFALSSCTIQKRTHRSGYYIDWHKKSTNGITEKTSLKTNLVASADDKINLPEKEEHKFCSQVSIACGDTLYLLSGEKIICQITEINEADIKYKRCDDIEGPVYSKPKKIASKIEYITGVSEIINDVANSKGHNAFYPKKRVDYVKSININDKCEDTIFKISGDSLKCKIIEVTKDRLKYKKCVDTTNTIYTIERINLYATGKIVETEKQKYIEKNAKKAADKDADLAAKKEAEWAVQQTGHKARYHYTSILSFILSILTFIPFYGVLVGPFAILFAILSFKEIKERYGTIPGKTMTVVALILGIIGLILNLFIVIAIALYYGV